MFIAVLFTIASKWKKPKCPSAEELVKKIWYTHLVVGQSLSHFQGVLGENTGVLCHFLLQGIFSEENPHLLHWQLDSLPLSHQGRPRACILIQWSVTSIGYSTPNSVLFLWSLPQLPLTEVSQNDQNSFLSVALITVCWPTQWLVFTGNW